MNTPPGSGPAKPSHIQSLARALQLIETLTQSDRETSLTELSALLNWPKSTTYGILSTLRDYRYVDQSPVSGRYKLGVRFFEIGNIVSRSWEIRAIALPHMLKLNVAAGEIVHLATEDHGEILYLEKVDTLQKLHILSDPGNRLPMHCTGLGKVLLAYRNNAEVNFILSHQGMAAMTPYTITDPVLLKQQLETIRQQELAPDDRELHEEISCVAAPLFDKNNRVKFAVSVSGLQANMYGPKRDLIIRALKQCTRDISGDFGSQHFQP